MSLAVDERAAICDEFDRSGPDRPTLCDGWQARDLLAHLLMRERQPWASAGLVVPALAPVTERAMEGYAAMPWTEMVELLRGGAPAWSPFRVGKIDEMGNGGEFFVHHEDLRRGEPGWKPRPADPVRDAEIWAMLRRMGGLVFRKSPVGLVVRRPDGAQQVVKAGPGVVTLVGEPGELLLYAFGRDAAQVEPTGAPADLAAFAGMSRGV